MLFVTVLWTARCVTNENTRKWVQKNAWLAYVAMFAAIAYALASCCWSGLYKIQREVPTNYFVMAFITVIYSYIVGFICTVYEPSKVLEAAICTMALFVGLSTLACFVKTKNLSWLWAILAVVGIMLFPAIIFFLIFPTRLVYTAILILLVILFGLYILWHTKVIMKQLSLDDYVLGAIILYLDIINMFLLLLRLFGGRS